MKLLSKIFAIFVISLLLFECSGDPSVEVKAVDIEAPLIDSVQPEASLPVEDLVYPIDTIVLKDIDGDKKDDSVFIHEPSIIEAELTCRDEVCNTKFVFANATIPTFNHEQALGGVLGNAGDLDDDGMCELYFVPDWFTSNWTGLNIYSLKENNWILLGQGSVRREGPDMESELHTPYEKRLIKHKGYFEILENVMDEDGNEKLVPKKIYFKK